VRVFHTSGSISSPADAELEARRKVGEALRVIDVRIVNEPRRQR
jgi:hypothetical protein